MCGGEAGTAAVAASSSADGVESVKGAVVNGGQCAGGFERDSKTGAWVFVKRFQCGACVEGVTCVRCIHAFCREHEAMSRIARVLGHDNTYVLCPVSVDEKNLTLRYPRGDCDLFEWFVGRGGSVCEGERVSVLLGVARGLHFLATKAKIAHGDVKLENVMRMADSTVRLIDFGYARSVRRGRVNWVPDVGTPSYAAPEWVAEVRRSRRAVEPGKLDLCLLDVWAFGVMAFILAFGFNPWEKRFAHKGDDWERYVRGREVEKLTEGYVGLLDMCLSADPRDRAEWDEVVEHLESMMPDCDDVLTSDCGVMLPRRHCTA